MFCGHRFKQALKMAGNATVNSSRRIILCWIACTTLVSSTGCIPFIRIPGVPTVGDIPGAPSFLSNRPVSGPPEVPASTLKNEKLDDPAVMRAQGPAAYPPPGGQPYYASPGAGTPAPAAVQTYQPPPGEPAFVQPAQPGAAQPGFAQPGAGQPAVVQPGTTFAQPDVGAGAPILPGGQPGVLPPPGAITGPPVDDYTLTPYIADIDAYVQEARTGRFMFGVGVNSDAGVTGQITIDERNFNIANPPTSWDDIANGTAFRGAGQGFRLEAQPGTQVQRYMVTFTEPYLFNSLVSLNLSAFYFDRNYFDWDERRLGGRAALGYRLTHNVSASAALRAENINIHDPRVGNVEELNEVVGDNAFYSTRFALTHDTRDSPFAPTEGHLVEFSYEQAFGDFTYPKFELDIRRYFLVYERPDGSGRHTISYGLRGGITGDNTPLYDHFFAGGFSTLRGFDFRGASPVKRGVRVGGDLRLLGSVEYQFPLTADDMLKGVVFCDFGTVEEDLKIEGDAFRVAPGLGLRISIPALGPAPLALDFAFPVASEITDDEQIFSFFIGVGR